MAWPPRSPPRRLRAWNPFSKSSYRPDDRTPNSTTSTRPARSQRALPDFQASHCRQLRLRGAFCGAVAYKQGLRKSHLTSAGMCASLFLSRVKSNTAQIHQLPGSSSHGLPRHKPEGNGSRAGSRPAWPFGMASPVPPPPYEILQNEPKISCRINKSRLRKAQNEAK